MVGATWPAEFEEFVRGHLPGLRDDEPLTAELVLADHGLDSLRRVSLLVALEDGFGITFPDELLAGNTFDTTGSLWAGFEQVVGVTRS